MKPIVIFLLLISPAVYGGKPGATYAEALQPAVFSLTMVMMHDVVNPPAAARYYAYCMLGAYEIVAQNNPRIPSLQSFIKAYQPVPLTVPASEYDYRIAAVYCILETGRLMLPSGERLKEDEDKFIQSLKKNRVAEGIIKKSVAVANAVAMAIVAYAKTDNYGKLSARLRYTPVKGDGYWYPTPPAYMEAVEPNWRTIRPLVIDSCNAFRPPPPAPFSTDSNSAFYKLVKEVYDVSRHSSAEQLAIASFWDCNPFVVATSGHMAIGFKKISPGGHWMNIAGIAAKKAGLSFNQSVLLQTIVAVTLMDAFISCWDEKYHSNRVRPETVINRSIDIRWQPLLQTPPFPEYPSGHSVISTAAAGVLSYLLGGHFSYTDNSEELFEIPPRSFTSFRQAADEAAISRLYGGIHFRDAIENGQTEGEGVAGKIIARVKAAGILPFTGTDKN